jgi:hypothetical protein
VTLQDGLYSVELQTPLGTESGVLIVSGNRLRGGDDTFAYSGTQSPAHRGFTAEIEAKRHCEGRASVFTREPGHIHLVCKPGGVDAICTGLLPKCPA